jgi:hypothetical protein
LDGFDTPPLVVEAEAVVLGRDGSFDVLMNQAWINQETFREEANSAAGVGKSDEADTAIPPGTTYGLHVQPAEAWRVAARVVDDVGSTLAELPIAMVLVVELLESRCFRLEHGTSWEMLSPEEAFVKGVVKALNNAVAPRFSLRDEDDFDAQQEAQPHDDAEASGVSIGATEGEFIVDLEELWYPQSSPLGQKCCTEGLCVLALKRLQGNGVAIGIDEVTSVEANAAREVPRTDKIQLVEYSWSCRLDRWIWWPMVCSQLGKPESVSPDNPVDRPDPRQGIDPQAPELPLYGDSPALGILMPQELFADLTHQMLRLLAELPGLAARPPRTIVRPTLGFW